VIGCQRCRVAEDPSAVPPLLSSFGQRLTAFQSAHSFYGPTMFGKLTPCVMHDSGSPTTSCCEYTCPGLLQSPEGLGRALAADGSSQLRLAIPEGAELLDEIACAAGNTGRLSTVADHAGAVPITKVEITAAAAVLKIFIAILVSSFLLTAHCWGSHREGVTNERTNSSNGRNRRFYLLRND